MVALEGRHDFRLVIRRNVRPYRAGLESRKRPDDTEIGRLEGISNQVQLTYGKLSSQGVIVGRVVFPIRSEREKSEVA